MPRPVPAAAAAAAWRLPPGAAAAAAAARPRRSLDRSRIASQRILNQYRQVHTAVRAPGCEPPPPWVRPSAGRARRQTEAPTTLRDGYQAITKPHLGRED